MRQIYNQLANHKDDEPDLPTETSLEQILTFIHSHWEKVIEKTRAETDAYLECKVKQKDLKLHPQKKTHTQLCECIVMVIVTVTMKWQMIFFMDLQMHLGYK